LLKLFKMKILHPKWLLDPSLWFRWVHLSSNTSQVRQNLVLEVRTWRGCVVVHNCGRLGFVLKVGRWDQQFDVRVEWSNVVMAFGGVGLTKACCKRESLCVGPLLKMGEFRGESDGGGWMVKVGGASDGCCVSWESVNALWELIEGWEGKGIRFFSLSLWMFMFPERDSDFWVK